ncbi:LysR family transcriptional regulator [Fodinicurvata sp. EGI_FJ10296]|uniref:LysR family transcriptional regulator n=1 Tax=Fodinicurvata sp. EGI_FJ10296 TaxID=3231908 RepID=UPI00345699C8
MTNTVELRHVRYFLKVAEELHFGRASELLGVSQAPLSQQIRQLEERLGVRLFERTTRSVRLTPAGEVFLDRARQVMRSMEEGVEATQMAGGRQAGRLTISSVYLGLYTVLPPALSAFAANYPTIKLDIEVHTTEDQLKALNEGRIDLALVRPPRSASGLRYKEVYREGFVAVLPANSPLAEKRDFDIADLRDQPFLTYSSIIGVSYQDVVFQHCRLAGFRPQMVQEVSHTLAIVTMVAAGLGVGVIPAWVQHMPMDNVAYRPLPLLPNAVSLVVAWREDTINQFVAPLVAQMETYDGGDRSASGG